MRNALKFVIALIVTILLMLTFRAVAFTVFTVNGAALSPDFVAGDRVLVNRWSYGLRIGNGGLDGGTRWLASAVERGDLVAYNCPPDSQHCITAQPVFIGYCKGVPGDTVKLKNIDLTLPGKQHPVTVSAANATMLAFLYNRYEGKAARAVDGRLFVDGVDVRKASFSRDYYWFLTGRKDNCADSRFYGPLPEECVIGRVSMLLYSIVPACPLFERLRHDRWLLFIKDGAKASHR